VNLPLATSFACPSQKWPQQQQVCLHLHVQMHLVAGWVFTDVYSYGLLLLLSLLLLLLLLLLHWLQLLLLLLLLHWLQLLLLLLLLHWLQLLQRQLLLLHHMWLRLHLLGD
jgi:hypothetical protein